MTYQRLNSSQWDLPPWPFLVAVRYAGRFKGKTMYGTNVAVGLGYQDVWNVGGDLSYLSSAETLNIDSSSASDAAAGIGARTVFISGLDDDYNEISETITMNGVANVVTTHSYLRVLDLYIDTVGSSEVNVGNITATSSGSATIQARILASVGQASMAFATIPKGYYGIVTGVNGSAVGLESIILDFQVRELNKGWRVRHRDNVPAASISNNPFMPSQSPILIPEYADFKVRATKAVGASTSIVTAQFSYYLVDKREVRL
jgi:hypothetical protein